MKRKLTGLTLMLAALNAAVPLFSHAETASTEIRISGTVQAGSGCVINNNQPIIVEFGEMQIDDVIDGLHSKYFQFDIDCPGLDFGAPIKLQFRGKEFSYYPGSGFLDTSKDYLFINITRANTTMRVNQTWLSMIQPDSPTFSAKLGVYENARPTTGEFNATATVVVEIQ